MKLNNDDMPPEKVYYVFSKVLNSCENIEQTKICRQWADTVLFDLSTPSYLANYWRERMKLEAFYKLEKLENKR